MTDSGNDGLLLDKYNLTIDPENINSKLPEIDKFKMEIVGGK